MHTKSEQKIIGNWFFAPIFFKNSLKTGFPIRIVIRYFLFEKKAFNGLLKVIGLQKYFINDLWLVKGI